MAGEMRILGARAGEFESGFAFGVVRQLFEPLLATAPREVREDLLSGAAALAEPLFDATSVAEPEESDQAASFAVLHGSASSRAGSRDCRSSSSLRCARRSRVTSRSSSPSSSPTRPPRRSGPGRCRSTRSRRSRTATTTPRPSLRFARPLPKRLAATRSSPSRCSTPSRASAFRRAPTSRVVCSSSGRG